MSQYLWCTETSCDFTFLFIYTKERRYHNINITLKDIIKQNTPFCLFCTQSFQCLKKYPERTFLQSLLAVQKSFYNDCL